MNGTSPDRPPGARRPTPAPAAAPIHDAVVIGLREATAALRAAQQATGGAPGELGGSGTEPAHVVDATAALLDALDGLLVHGLSRLPEPDGRPEPGDTLIRLAATVREVRDLTAPHPATPAPTAAAESGEPGTSS